MNKLLLILIFFFAWNGTIHTTVKTKNMNGLLVKFEAVQITPKYRIIVKPDLKKALHKKPLNFQNNNPGNLRSCKTRLFRVFKTLEEGYIALLHDLELKISSKSLWTDSTTTIYEFICIYAPRSENDVNTYIKQFCTETGLLANDLLNTQLLEVVARGIIKVENPGLYKLLYA